MGTSGTDIITGKPQSVGTLQGTVYRHIPMRNAQGGTIVVNWDNGNQGQHSASSLQVVDQDSGQHEAAKTAATWSGTWSDVKARHPLYAQYGMDSVGHTITAAKTAAGTRVKHQILAEEVQEGDYLDSSGKVRVHNVHVRNGTVMLAWRLRGSKAPGVRVVEVGERVNVWRRA